MKTCLKHPGKSTLACNACLNELIAEGNANSVAARVAGKADGVKQEHDRILTIIRELLANRVQVDRYSLRMQADLNELITRIELGR